MRALGGQGEDLVIPRLGLSLRESVLGRASGHKGVAGCSPQSFPKQVGDELMAAGEVYSPQ